MKLKTKCDWIIFLLASLFSASSIAYIVRSLCFKFLAPQTNEGNWEL